MIQFEFDNSYFLIKTIWHIILLTGKRIWCGDFPIILIGLMELKQLLYYSIYLSGH